MRNAIVMFAVLAVSATSLTARSDVKDVKELERAANVLNDIMRAPDKGIPSDLLAKAVCVGVIPSELKAAFIVGGSFGHGVLVCRRNGNGPWGAPSMFTLGGGSFGFQIGGESTDVVFLVMNASGAKKLLQDSVKLGADASVTAGPVGRTAEGATDAQLHAEILSYSRTRGLFAGVSLDGAVVKQDRDENARLYGHPTGAKDILIRGDVATPAAARPLDNLLTRYAPRGGEPFSV